jgi:hypothetical protein
VKPTVLWAERRNALDLDNGWVIEAKRSPELLERPDRLISVKARCRECGVEVEAGRCTPNEYFQLGARVAALPACSHVEWLEWALIRNDQEMFGRALRHLAPLLQEAPNDVRLQWEDSLGLGEAFEPRITIDFVRPFPGMLRLECLLCWALSQHVRGLFAVTVWSPAGGDRRHATIRSEFAAQLRVAVDSAHTAALQYLFGRWTATRWREYDWLDQAVLEPNFSSSRLGLLVLAPENERELEALGAEIAEETAGFFGGTLGAAVDVCIRSSSGLVAAYQHRAEGGQACFSARC